MKILLVILIILLSAHLGYLLGREEVQKVRDEHNRLEVERIRRAVAGDEIYLMPGHVDGSSLLCKMGRHKMDKTEIITQIFEYGTEDEYEEDWEYLRCSRPGCYRSVYTGLASPPRGKSKNVLDPNIVDRLSPKAKEEGK